MKIEKDKIEEFKAIANSMIKWINDNCHPHTHVYIDTERAELSEGVLAFATQDHFKD